MQTTAPSLAEALVEEPRGAHVLRAGFLGAAPVFVETEGVVRVGATRHALDAVVLSTAIEGGALALGCDDGAVRLIRESGAPEIAASAPGRWIDAVALHPDGSLAFTAGREAVFRDARGREKRIPLTSTAEAIAFRNKGLQIAVAQYGGVQLWMPGTLAPPETLEWKGSHIGVTFSPDGRFVVTAMQENQLHGWRLPEKAHMRMSGYPAKTRSMSWSHDGNWLATSGAEAAIIWPFASKEGPMGKPPRECGVRPQRVSAVAFHPKALVLAVGYVDGFIMLCRLTDAAEILVRAVTDGDAVTALAWDSVGGRLAFGAADGASGLLTISG